MKTPFRALLRLGLTNRRPTLRLSIGLIVVVTVIGTVLAFSLMGDHGGAGIVASLAQAEGDEVQHSLSSEETVQPTVTPTKTAEYMPTPLPTATNMPPPSPTPLPVEWDKMEPNDTLDTAATVSVNQTVQGLNLTPVNGKEDVDFFTLYGKKGQIILVSTFVGLGTDTRMALFSASGELLSENDDRSPTDLGSAIGWVVDRDRWYVIKVESAVPGAGGEYDLVVRLQEPTPTPVPPTPRPDPTATIETGRIEADEAEPNNDYGSAADIVNGTTYNLTLPEGDLDIFRFFVEAGVQYRCDTHPHGVDTVLVIRDQNQVEIGRNNNRSVADVGSTVEWQAEYNGFVYVVVEGLVGQGEYALICTGIEPTPVPRPVGGGSVGNSNPVPSPTPTLDLPPTPTPVQLSLRFVTQINPTVEPEQVTTFRIRIAYDENNNKADDPGEGVRNISVRAVSGGRVKNWVLTDERGEAVLTVRGDVDRIVVPIIGWVRNVRVGNDALATVLLPPINLPVVIPVETPEVES